MRSFSFREEMCPMKDEHFDICAPNHAMSRSVGVARHGERLEYVQCDAGTS